jgi:hypothetical protein
MNKKKLTNNLFGGSLDKNFVSSGTGTANLDGGTQTELPKAPKLPAANNPSNNLMKALKE